MRRKPYGPLFEVAAHPAEHLKPSGCIRASEQKFPHRQELSGKRRNYYLVAHPDLKSRCPLGTIPRGPLCKARPLARQKDLNLSLLGLGIAPALKGGI